MATRDGSDPSLKFHLMKSPAAAPIEIHLRILKNVKLPPICAFLLIYNKLPKLRTGIRFLSPARTIPAHLSESRFMFRLFQLAGGSSCNTVEIQALEINF